MDIYIEPVLPAPRLVVFGASPVAQALVRLGKALGYTVDAVDPDADRATFPEADRVLASAQAGAAGPWVCAVVATMGQWDEDGVRAALALAPPAAYVGVVASRTRFGQIRDVLVAGGTPADVLARLTNPAGVDIGAQLPEEIALSVLAQIIQVRHAVPREPAATPPVTEAIDPICGMTVVIATARHTAEFEGRTFYFCAAGCRERFLREPERYAAAGSSGGGGMA